MCRRVPSVSALAHFHFMRLLIQSDGWLWLMLLHIGQFCDSHANYNAHSINLRVKTFSSFLAVGTIILLNTFARQSFNKLHNIKICRLYWEQVSRYDNLHSFPRWDFIVVILTSNNIVTKINYSGPLCHQWHKNKTNCLMWEWKQHNSARILVKGTIIFWKFSEVW